MKKFLTIFCFVPFFGWASEKSQYFCEKYLLNGSQISFQADYITAKLRDRYEGMVKYEQNKWRNGFATSLKYHFSRSEIPFAVNKLCEIRHVYSHAENLDIYVMMLSDHDKTVVYAIKKNNKIAILRKKKEELQTISWMPTLYHLLKKEFERTAKRYNPQKLATPLS
jgi:hypothetical protein